MTVRELLKELLKDELIGCEVESIAYRDQVEFTIQDKYGYVEN